MKLRKYDTRIEILRKSGERNAWNEEVDDLVSLGFRWASVRLSSSVRISSSREIISNGATEFGETMYRVEFRKDDLTELIDREYSLRFEGKTLDLQPINSRDKNKVVFLGRG